MHTTTERGAYKICRVKFSLYSTADALGASPEWVHGRFFYLGSSACVCVYKKFVKMHASIVVVGGGKVFHGAKKKNSSFPSIHLFPIPFPFQNCLHLPFFFQIFPSSTYITLYKCFVCSDVPHAKNGIFSLSFSL